MAAISPADIRLPEFVNPVLSYLQEHLPSHLYRLTVSVLANSVALLSTFSTLLRLLIPSVSSTQDLLPPIIAFLIAYFTLLSLYRTTSWFLRTSFWMLKWGILLSVVVGSLGWLIGATTRRDEIGRVSVFDALSVLVTDVVGDGQRTDGRISQRRFNRRKPLSSKARAKGTQKEGQDRNGGESGYMSLIDAMLGVTSAGLQNTIADKFGLKDDSLVEKRVAKSKGSTSR